MNDNIFVMALENERKRRDAHSARFNWSMCARNRMVEVLENNGATVSNHLWYLLLGEIQNLYISDSGKISYSTIGRPSKKVRKLITENSQLIADNYIYILNGKRATA